MSGFRSPSTANLLSSDGGPHGSIAPDVEPDLETGRAGPTNSTNAPAGGALGSQQGQMATAQREQSIWEQSAYVSLRPDRKRAVPKAYLSMFRSHPVALFFLFFFRSAAIVTYLLCGFFSNSCSFRPYHAPLDRPSDPSSPTSRCVLCESYSFSTTIHARSSHGLLSQTVLVVVLLSMDFWTVRVRNNARLPHLTALMLFMQ